MVLFPLALIWLIVVIVWVVRNEVKPEEGRLHTWTRRPRSPRHPGRGGPDRSGGRRGSATVARHNARPGLSAARLGGRRRRGSVRASLAPPHILWLSPRPRRCSPPRRRRRRPLALRHRRTAAWRRGSPSTRRAFGHSAWPPISPPATFARSSSRPATTASASISSGRPGSARSSRRCTHGTSPSWRGTCRR